VEAAPWASVEGWAVSVAAAYLAYATGSGNVSHS